MRAEWRAERGSPRRTERANCAEVNTLDRPRQALATALAGLAGYVDAVGFLSADRYFVSFMSGNTTRLGTDLVMHGRKAIVPALLILGFVLGVTAGNVVAHCAGAWRKPAVLSLVTGLLAAGSAFALTDRLEAMMAAMVLAMGALNNTMQRDEAPVALTYLTGALVRMGQGLGALLTGRKTDGARAYLTLWLALASGAAMGATMFIDLGTASLPIAVAFATLLTLAGWRIARVSRKA